MLSETWMIRFSDCEGSYYACAVRLCHISPVKSSYILSTSTSVYNMSSTCISNSISLPNDTNIDIENIRQQFHVNEESDETNPTAQATERKRRMRARWTAEQHAEYNECDRDRCWNIY